MQSFHFAVNGHPIPDWSTDWRMAEKWGQIIHNLDREDRDFEEAMRGQVGTTSSSPNSSNKMGSLENAYWDWYYCPVYNGKEKSQNLDYVCLQTALISIETNSFLYPFST